MPTPLATPPQPWRSLRALPRIAREASKEWLDDNAPRLGASVAFYTLLSLAPLIVITIAVAAAAFGRDAAEGRLASEIQGVAGAEVARRVQEIIGGAYEPRTGVIASLLGIATLVFGASSIFVELHGAMNTIWHVSAPTDGTNAAAVIRLIKDRFYSFATVLGAGVLLLASLAVSTSIGAMNISVPRAAAFTMSYLVVTALFATLYKIVPDVKLKWTDVALAAIIGSSLFMIGKQLLELYFARAGLGSAYRAAGSPLVVLLWVYYSAQLFFWGAEFSKIYTTTVGSHSCRRPPG